MRRGLGWHQVRGRSRTQDWEGRAGEVRHIAKFFLGWACHHLMKLLFKCWKDKQNHVESSRLCMIFTPPKTNMDPKIVVWKMYPLFNMAMFGIYIDFLGCISHPFKVAWCFLLGHVKHKRVKPQMFAGSWRSWRPWLSYADKMIHLY